ncbi:MAG: GatB/YqeY domain-containing protein [Alphaproteobacteria bacterium]
MDKRTEFSVALKEALKNKDKIAMSTIRLMMAALKDRDITAREKGDSDGIGDAEILQMLQSMIKQRQDSSKIYSEAGRDDLAEREEIEIDVIRGFMPKQLSEEEVGAIIDEKIAALKIESIKDMGKIMGVLKSEYAGQIDMGKAGGLVKARLG